MLHSLVVIDCVVYVWVNETGADHIHPHGMRAHFHRQRLRRFVVYPIPDPDALSHVAATYDGRLMRIFVDGEQLETDPGEFDNLWDEDSAQGLRFDLMKKSFDALAFATDIGTPHVTQF